MASTACLTQAHYFEHPSLHPERLYEQLLALAGSLMTFSKSRTLADLPPYRHDAPDVRRLLRPVHAQERQRPAGRRRVRAG
jgi:predicted component of type VI protein secretion system